MVLTGLSLAILLSQLGTNIINVALPHPGEGARCPVRLGPMGGGQLSVGGHRADCRRRPVGDQLGKKRLYLWGLAVFMAASVLCAPPAPCPLLIARRAGQGLGARS